MALSPDLFDAVIFDMDGVVTRTAGVHAKAWKTMFDEFLRQWAEKTGESFVPFAVDRDYQRFVDGKPRYSGVSDFLSSRNIELPWGTTDDAADQETICGLGNRKNLLLQKLLDENGVERYECSVVLIHDLKASGIKTAIISASKNCRKIMQAAGIEDLFDVRVDGIDAEQLGFPGKPDPDIFLCAATRLAASPGRTVVIEDSQAGVEAGHRGGFALVIGVNRAAQTSELARFANVVVDDLKEVIVEENARETLTDELPLAMEHVKEMGDRIREREAVIFLDYDGTLTPIVERPELAGLSEEMRQALRDLAKKYTVAIVSGRDLEDVRNLVSIDGIIYAGSHGLDISGPDGHMSFQPGLDYLPSLDLAEQSLQKQLLDLPGAQIERKRFAIAVHFRRVAEAQVPHVEAAVDQVLSQHEDLRKTGGKKIFELRPDIDWDKGKAISWILRKLKLDRDDVLPIYIGDDLTDEDAFREIRNRGLAILVKDENRPTLAHYALENSEEVRLFLHMLTALFQEERS